MKSEEVIALLVEVARCAYHALDNTEDDGKELHWFKPSFDALSAAMDKLDELPDDKPNYTLGPAGKAEWALRAVINPGPVWLDEHGEAHGRVSDEQIEAVLEQALANVRERSGTLPSPIDMILHCPACGKQHIDAPDWRPVPSTTAFAPLKWDNPPHRSHLCHGCGNIWRPADVPTNGVAAIKTKGKNDSPLAPGNLVLMPSEATDDMVLAAEKAQTKHYFEDRQRGGKDPELGVRAIYRVMVAAFRGKP